MNEETSTTRLNVAADSASEGELSLLRKEVIEARNLVIKTDNLLKNMHAEIKKMGARQDEFAKRRFWSSGTAYVCISVIAVAARGATALTVIWRRASSLAEDLVRPMIAAFAAE